jgi:type VI protein secretion system component VasK
MSLESRITALATAIAAQCNTLKSNQGALASLSTTNKSSLVAAINELATIVDGIDAAEIDDAATSGADVTWSVDQIKVKIAAAIDALVDGAPGTLDTLNELAAALADSPDTISGINTALGLRVRVDASQSFDSTQQTQARANIGAQSAAAIGDADRDFAADFTGALT